MPTAKRRRSQVHHQRAVTRPPKPDLPAGLCRAHREFCLNYLANGFNASAAYASSHPNASPATARADGHKLLTKPDIRAWLSEHLEDRLTALQMGADEALAEIAAIARLDIRLLYGADGILLNPRDWPDAIGPYVRSIKEGRNGERTITLLDKTTALRTILEVTNRLRNPVADSVDALADAIRADQSRTATT